MNNLFVRILTVLNFLLLVFLLSQNLSAGQSKAQFDELEVRNLTIVDEEG